MTQMFEKFDELCIVEENLHQTRSKWESDMNELKKENFMLREKLFTTEKKKYALTHKKSEVMCTSPAWLTHWHILLIDSEMHWKLKTKM